MTGLVQSIRAAEDSGRADVSTPTEPRPPAKPVRRGPGWFAAIGGWRGIGWFACAVAGVVAIAWFIFLSHGEIGSKADWFFGAVVFCVVMVTMWQTLNIQREANQNAADAAERQRIELAAAEERSARELALIQTLHRVEMDAKEKSHRAELEAERELARVERLHLVHQLQKQALIEVSRTVNGHTQLLATLWNQAASVLSVEDRDERELAMNPIFEQISQVVNEFSVELSNAHLLIEDDRLHRALDRVNEAVLMGIRVAEDVHDAVVQRSAPHLNPVPPVQRLMQSRAAEARHLAWSLLRAGLDEISELSELGESVGDRRLGEL
jgi:PAS domain-containing protein